LNTHRLIRAHDSIDTYVEQARQLMMETSKLWEIHQRSHESVYQHGKRGVIKRDSLRALLEQNRSELTWVREFIHGGSGPRLPADYEDALDKTKGVIRDHVFARTSDS
jgi:hypothetical protein